jgi:hypothetical protein
MGSDAETVAIRHHLDALILKLAAAQAGSLDAVRDSRIHAEAALELLAGRREAACEHARIFGLGQTPDEWRCDGCGARWPKGAAAMRPAIARTGRPARESAPIPTRVDSERLDEPVNSL